MSKRKNRKKELEEIRRLAEKIKAGEEDLSSLHEKVIDVILTPMGEATRNWIELLETRLEPKYSVMIISGDEYEELMRYFDEAKAIFGWDLRMLFNCIRRDQQSHFVIEKDDFRVLIEYSLFFGRKLTVEFETPRGSRKFKIYEEKRGGF